MRKDETFWYCEQCDEATIAVANKAWCSKGHEMVVMGNVTKTQ